MVVKGRLHSNLSLSDAVEALIEQMLLLIHAYNERININHMTTLNLIDKRVFNKVRELLTYYSINLTMTEWRATKDIGDNINTRRLESF